MHPIDIILLFSIANVVAWPVSLYVENDLIRIVGHMLASMLGAFVVGFLALKLFPESSKFVMIFGGFIGAGLFLYLLRFRKWR